MTPAPPALALALLCAAAPVFAAEGEPLDPNRREYGGMPVVWYDSDVGLQLGGLVTLAQFAPDATPFRYRLGLLLSASIKLDEDGDVSLPFHDDAIEWDVPGLLGGALRFTGGVHFRSYTDCAWYGLGSASSAEVPPEAGARYHHYTRVYPTADVHSRWRVWERAGPRGRLDLLLGFHLSYSTAAIDPASRLGEDVALSERGEGPDAATLRRLLHGTGDHVLGLVKVGLLADTRDQETNPSRGVYAELSARFAPGPEDLRHAGFTALATAFYPLWPDRLVLAGRAFGDFLVGQPPFYLLTLAGTIWPRDAPGGGAAVRGVLQHRYAGMAKAVAGLELRARLARFTLLEQRFAVGAAAFGEGGRVWADYRRVVLAGRDADADRWATGVGGGLRLHWGETFIVRVDAAWSPSDRTRGFYVDIGQIY